MHEHVEERRLVILVDELEERLHARARLALVRGELGGGEAPARERLQDRLRGELPRAQRDVDAAREDRIDERDRVADRDAPVADDRRVLVGEVRLGADGRDPLGAGEETRQVLRAAHHVFEERLVRADPRARGPRVHDGADARHVVRERDPPVPPVLADVDADVAFLHAAHALRPAEVGEHRHLPEIRDAPTLADAAREEARAAARVDEHRRAELRAGAVAEHGGGHAVVVELHVLHRRRLVHVHAERARVVEEDRVELRARHLERVLRPRHVGQEVERRLEVVHLVDEGGAVLDLEAGLLDLLPHAELLEQQHGRRHQRFADVKAGEHFTLDQRDLAAAGGEESRGARATGTAADDDDVVLRAFVHRVRLDGSHRVSPSTRASAAATSGGSARWS